MKTIKKFLKPFSILMSSSILIMSCEKYDNANDVSEFQQTELNGEELFKSIIFADGELTEDIVAIQDLSQINNMSKSEVIEFRNFQDEVISYLKEKDQTYFDKFKKSMYSGNPKIVSEAISTSAKDILPLINSKLAVVDLSVDKIANNKNFSTDEIKNRLVEDQACGVVVVVAVAAAVAVAVIWVVAISAVAVVSSIEDTEAAITQQAISVQVAEKLSLTN